MFLKAQRLASEYALFVKDTFLDAYYYFIFSKLRVRKKKQRKLQCVDSSACTFD